MSCVCVIFFNSVLYCLASGTAGFVVGKWAARNIFYQLVMHQAVRDLWCKQYALSFLLRRMIEHFPNYFLACYEFPRFSFWECSFLATTWTNMMHKNWSLLLPKIRLRGYFSLITLYLYLLPKVIVVVESWCGILGSACPQSYAGTVLHGRSSVFLQVSVAACKIAFLLKAYHVSEVSCRNWNFLRLTWVLILRVS